MAAKKKTPAKKKAGKLSTELRKLQEAQEDETMGNILKKAANAAESRENALEAADAASEEESPEEEEVEE